MGELLIGFNQDDYCDIFNIDIKKYEIKSVKAENDKDRVVWSLFFDDIYLIDTRIITDNIIINDKDINK